MADEDDEMIAVFPVLVSFGGGPERRAKVSCRSMRNLVGRPVNEWSWFEIEFYRPGAAVRR